MATAGYDYLGDIPVLDDTTPQERLFVLAMKGDAAGINDLLKSDPSINLKTKNELGLTPLQLTVEYEQLPATIALLRREFKDPRFFSRNNDPVDLARSAIRKDQRILIEGLVDSRVLSVDVVVDPATQQTLVMYAARKGKVGTPSGNGITQCY